MATEKTVPSYAALEKSGKFVPWTREQYPVGASDVRVDVTHCGICHSDIHNWDNDWGVSKYPLVPGHEVVGKVAEIGKDVKEFKVGDLVGIGPSVWSCKDCETCKSGDSQMCPKMVQVYGQKYPDGKMTYGGFGTQTRSDARFVCAIPDGLSAAEAAPLLCAGATVFAPLDRWTKKGMSVGIVGIGGLGHLGVQYAAKMGLKVTAISRGEAKKAEAEKFGATAYINSKDEKAMKAAANSLDFLLMTACANFSLDPYLDMLRLDGRMCFLGAPADPYLKVNVFKLLFKRLSLCSSLIGSPDETRKMLKFSAEHGVKPMIEVCPASKVNEAVKKVVDGKARYRCVLEHGK